ncbi:MAG: HAD family phosphatase [Pseudomonadota bacterium]
MSVELVIFDCDGVLVDTENITNAWIADQITAAGFPTTTGQCRQRFVGLSMSAIRPKVIEENGIDIGEDFVARWETSSVAIFSVGVAPIVGVTRAVNWLKENDIRYCVASSGTVEKMHMTLGSAGLLDEFRGVLFSSTMVPNGKPAPDLFLYAAEKMGVAPQNCVVIEDSPFGAQAANAAGIKCFGYTADPLTDAKGLAEQGASLFTSMSDLTDLITPNRNEEAN